MCPTEAIGRWLTQHQYRFIRATRTGWSFGRVADDFARQTTLWYELPYIIAASSVIVIATTAPPQTIAMRWRASTFCGTNTVDVAECSIDWGSVRVSAAFFVRYKYPFENISSVGRASVRVGESSKVVTE